MDPTRRTLVLCTTALLGLMGNPPAWGDGTNKPPMAEAGLPRYVAKDPVRLDGSGSYDPDHSGPLTYAWTQVSGPPLVITDANTATPTISGFVQTEQIQPCEFALTVSDGQDASSPDTVRVVIVPTFSAGNLMILESRAFDPQKPTVVFFGGGKEDGTGGAVLGGPLWCEKANIISFQYMPDEPGLLLDGQVDRTWGRPGDIVIVYLSAVAPDYRQPIQTLGHSVGGVVALDVALRLNLDYADARYAVNHATLCDPSSWIVGIPEFQRRVDVLLAHPVDGEQCWVESYEAGNVGVWSSALNVVFPPVHQMPRDWYRNSLAMAADDNTFNHGVVAGAYWSVVGPGRNLQLALTPQVQTYKFRWIGSEIAGHMEFYDEANYPGRLPEPVTLTTSVAKSEVSAGVDGVVLSCHESENAVGYQLLFGSDPCRVMDYHLVSDTPDPPNGVIATLPFEETWWTVKVRDAYGSTIHAHPWRVDAYVLSVSIQNITLGKRYGYLQAAIDEASDGHEIVVGQGTCHENIDFKGKSLVLRSVDPNDPRVVAATILAGEGRAPVVTLSSGGHEHPLIEGLTITGGTAGISCGDATPTIRNCTVKSSGPVAIEFWYGYEPRVVTCTLLGQVAEGGDASLIAHWKLDEEEGSVAHNDTGDPTYDAKVYGNPSWRPDGGRVGGALAFDGKDDRVSSPFVVNPAEGSFSVFAWVKGGTPGQVVISQSAKADWLLAASPGGELRTGLSLAGVPGLTAAVVVTDGDWHRIGLVWDGTNRGLYVDNNLAAQDSPTGLPGSSVGLTIGAGNKLAKVSFWQGLIDDVHIYNRAVKP